jgi:hypothetical protein
VGEPVQVPVDAVSVWPSTVVPATVGGAEFVGACVGVGAGGGGAEDPAGRSAMTCAIPPLEPPGFVDSREPVDPADESTESATVDAAPTTAVRHLTFMPLAVVGLLAEPYAVRRRSPAVDVVTEGAVRIFVFDVHTAPLDTSTAAVGSTPSYAAMPPAASVAEENVQTHELGSDAPASLTYAACVMVPAVDAAESLRTRAHPDGAEIAAADETRASTTASNASPATVPAGVAISRDCDATAVPVAADRNAVDPAAELDAT